MKKQRNKLIKTLVQIMLSVSYKIHSFIERVKPTT